MKEKKAVSPIIATILLIMIVIILAIIILLWTSSFWKEAVTKTIRDEEKRAVDWCKEISIDPFTGTDTGFRNVGNVPLYAYQIKTKTSGDSTKQRVDEHVPSQGVAIFDSIGAYDFYDEIMVLPIILGKSKENVQEVECPESDNFIIYSK